jgi:hypothetical protein
MSINYKSKKLDTIGNLYRIAHLLAVENDTATAIKLLDKTLPNLPKEKYRNESLDADLKDWLKKTNLKNDKERLLFAEKVLDQFKLYQIHFKD